MRNAQALCRKVDRVTVKGSVNPIALYTYDVPPVDAKTIEELYEVGARRSGQRARLHVSLPLSSLA